MTFLALIEGFGQGCDYTIDCNKSFRFFEAKDLEEAEKECRQIWEDHGGAYEKRIDSITLVEVRNSFKVSVDKWNEEGEEKIKQERIEKELAEAEARVEQLRAAKNAR